MTQLHGVDEPQIAEFGPCRVIGMSAAAKTGPDCAGLWHGPQGVIARLGEIEAAAGEGHPASFGLCRCLPGVTDGSFEYLAGIMATPASKVPKGMVEAHIPAGRYAVFTVQGLHQIGQAWEASRAWLAAHPEWESFCSPEQCDCATHPAFEFYPPEFPGSGKLFIYVPIRPAS